MKLLMSALIATVALVAMPLSASASWTHGSYTVNQVLESAGNYTYNGGSNGGVVDAVAPSNGASAIKVEFYIDYTGISGDPNLTITGQGVLTGGGSGANYSGSATVDASGGTITDGFTSPGSLNSTETLGAEPALSAPGTYRKYITGRAAASDRTGSSSWADSFVKFI